MTTELTLLTWSTALAFVQMGSTAGFITLKAGVSVSLGNRADFGMPEGALGRAVRAHRNMVESLAIFAAAVLIASIAGRNNALTTLGAQLFFWGRLAYFPLYVAGIAYVRTLAWTVAVVGIALMLVPLF